jgi:hypothetical protein
MKLDLFHFLYFVAAKLALATVAPKTPRVHFLFLAVDRIQRLDLWQRFLYDAPADQYRIILHCKEPVACRGQLKMSGISDDVLGKQIEVIDTPAPSAYCTDLVSAENRLLEVALQPPFATAGSPSPAKAASFAETKVHENTNPAPSPSSFLAKHEDFSNVSSISGDHPNDKYIFVSDSTIPAKSFAEVHWALTTGPDSHFCIFPREQWATAARTSCVDDDSRCPVWAQKGECERNPNFMHFRCQRSCQVCNDELGRIAGSAGVAFNEQIVAVKTHQWKVLNRADATRSVQLWKQGFLRHLMHMMHLNWHDSFRNHGCLDEFWHFAALYGVFPGHCMGKRNSHIRCNEWALQGECERNPAYMWKDCEAACAKCQLPSSKLANGAVAMNLENGAEVQGKCDTFVKWPTASAMGRSNGMVQLDQELAGLATMQRGNIARPETILKISPWGLLSLKKSSFLFVRKFTASSEIEGDCNPMVDIFSRDVFSQKSPPKSAWAGQGVWMVDEKNHVTLMTDPDSANSFLVHNEDMPEWSGTGSSCGRAVAVTFKNGQKWNGQLDTSNGDFISFDNGVIWCRDASWRGDGAWLNTYNNSVIIRSKCGFKVNVRDITNKDWSGRGQLDIMLGDTVTTTFNAKMKAKPVKLTATLSADGQSMHWHNGQTWTRDKKHWTPCACTPDGALWRLPSRPQYPVKAASKCFFFDIGPAAGHVDLDKFLVGYYDIGRFHPQDCEVTIMDPDPQKADYLRRQQDIYKTSFAVHVLPQTTPYSCEPSPTQGVDFANGKMHPAGSGGSRISLINIQRLLREKVLPQDHVVLRMDLGGIERDILSCLARSSSARLLDVMYLEVGGQDGSPMGVTDDEMQDSLKILKESGVKIMPIKAGYNHGQKFGMGDLVTKGVNLKGLHKPVQR